jgi:hypothetical protein
MEKKPDRPNLAQRFQQLRERVRSAELERIGREIRMRAPTVKLPEPNTYWLQFSKTPSGKSDDHGYRLYVDKIERAIVDTGKNRAIIFSHDGAPAQNFAVPDSRSVFEAVEKRLGLGRVKELRNDDGRRHNLTLLDLRAGYEERVAKFRERIPREKEAAHYAERAREDLNDQARNGGLSEKGQEARQHINAALTELDRSKGQWTKAAREEMEAARLCLHEAPVTEETKRAPFEPAAALLCDKALQTFEQEFASEQPAIERGEHSAGSRRAFRSVEREQDGGRSR